MVFTLQKPERDESFQVDLGECDGGAELGKIKKTIITIVNDEGLSESITAPFLIKFCIFPLFTPRRAKRRHYYLSLLTTAVRYSSISFFFMKEVFMVQDSCMQQH